MAERQPWGTTAHEALRWSFGLLARSEAMPNTLADMRSGTKRRGDDMTPLDYRAQGALIRQVAETLDDKVQAAHLVAYYLPKPIKERVAGGSIEWVDRFSHERAVAVRAVAHWLRGQAGAGVHYLAGFMEIEAQYCARRSNHHRIARALRVRFATARETRERLYAVLDALRDGALDRVQARLEAKGLVAYYSEQFAEGGGDVGFGGPHSAMSA